MWSANDGKFKLLDFGLTFHTDEDDLHQIQSPGKNASQPISGLHEMYFLGYKSPEATEWNKYKDEIKKKRKRKLQGTYSDLTKAAPAYQNGLQNIGVQSSQGSTPPVATPTESPIPSGATRTIMRAPPRKHRLSGVMGSSDRESIIVLDEYQRHGSRRGSNNSMSSSGGQVQATINDKAVAAAAAAVTAACNKWLSESSGIFTASTPNASSTNSVVQPSQDTKASSVTVSSSVTASTLLSSEASGSAVINHEDNNPEDSQEWRRGRTRSRSKVKGPRPNSICAALAEKDRPLMPNSASDM